MYNQSFWETDKHTRMLMWRDWRNSLKELPNESLYQTIAEWWRMVPMSSGKLDVWNDKNWPTPWELITFTSFCNPGKGLGIYYTLALLGIESELILAQKDAETTLLVRLEEEKLLNYYEGDVINVSDSSYETLKIFAPADMYRLVKV